MVFQNYSKAFINDTDFQKKLRLSAKSIYENVFKNSKVEWLGDKEKKVHILDKEFGVDGILHLTGSEQFLTFQEKYRRNKFWENSRYRDFTMEYKNASGTQYENIGELSRLASHIYFYGWANKEETGFIAWLILDILKFKLLVHSAGGIDCIGHLYVNEAHGRASFFSIKLYELKEAVLYSNNIDALLLPPLKFVTSLNQLSLI